MIVKAHGTDPHGKFKMYQRRFPDYSTFLTWVDSHAGWQDFVATDEDGRVFHAAAF